MNRLLILLLSVLALPVWALTYRETPSLAAQVASGDLPPVYQRLPAQPLVDPMTGQEPGQPGGRMQLLMGKPKDVRRMVTYGYARLVGFDANLELVPDILAAFEVEEGRRFTLTLRPGHRWSDGHPFTSEDFRYYWEDVASNEELSPFGPPNQLLVEGEPPHFEVLSDTQVRYTWQAPNPDFLLALAGPMPLFIYRPAHYLKQFHTRYVQEAELARSVGGARIQNRTWVGLHQRKDHQYKFDNPDLPTLQPWVPVTQPPSERFIFVRNPYYHRVDPQGYQLPYLDEVVMNIASSKLIPAKVGAGEADLHGRYLRLDNYTFLKDGTERNRFQVHLWRTSRGSRVSLYPNFNTNDETWRRLIQDVRFRRALSLGINRHEINQVIYFGLALEGADTVLPESPLYRPEYRSLWSHYDPKAANRLLDELGLTARNDRGIRLLPDGRPMEIVVQTAGESTEETDVLELIRDTWGGLGIKLHTKPTEREVFRNRVFAGDAIMSVWSGLENGIPSADMSPAPLAPSEQQQLQWPKWGKYYETGQESPPTLPEVLRLVELNQQWRHATSNATRREIWHEMLQIHAEQVFTLGTVAKVLQPIVVRNSLHNVPHVGLWNWEPNAYFGIYRPDRFWIDPEPTDAVAQKETP